MLFINFILGSFSFKVSQGFSLLLPKRFLFSPRCSDHVKCEEKGGTYEEGDGAVVEDIEETGEERFFGWKRWG